MIPLEYPCCGNCALLGVCRDKDTKKEHREKESELDEDSWSWCELWVAGGTNENK